MNFCRLSWIGIILMLYSCTDKITTFHISQDANTSDKITLSKYNFKEKKFEPLWNNKIESPNEIYVVNQIISEPTIYLFESKNHKYRIAQDRNGPIDIFIGDTLKLESKVAAVSNFNQVIQHLNSFYFSDLIIEFDNASKLEDQVSIQRLEQTKEKRLKLFDMSMQDTLRKFDLFALKYDALAYFDGHKHGAFLNEMKAKFIKRIPKANMTTALINRVDRINQLAIGKKAPSIVTNTITGNMIELSKINKQFILIDFWASWCRACRIENPKFRKLYNTYSSQGFEILSISIDEDPDAYKHAIQKDNMVWTQILDSEKKLYSVFLLSSLPSNFLLDHDNRIISKNINAKDLAEFLKKNIKIQR